MTSSDSALPCLLEAPPRSEHLTQVYSGFALLAAQGKVSVRFRLLRPSDPATYNRLARVQVGSARIVFDTADHPSLSRSDLAWSTSYFKRSFDEAVVGATADGCDVQPLGFNYSVYARGDWAWRRAIAALRTADVRDLRGTAVQIGRLSSIISRLTGAAPSRACGDVALFEAHPGWDEDEPFAILLTRTWDPQREAGRPERAAERREMNEMRAACIRALRNELGRRFIGGFSPTPDALRDYPDCIAPTRTTEKLEYLSLVRRAQVCVATAGLLGTNGWRMGEYVAASRAIVSEPLQHAVPGGFRDGEHHRTFTTPDGCLDAVTSLMAAPAAALDMGGANQSYYERYLRPDALVWNALETALASTR